MKHIILHNTILKTYNFEYHYKTKTCIIILHNTILKTCIGLSVGQATPCCHFLCTGMPIVEEIFGQIR